MGKTKSAEDQAVETFQAAIEYIKSDESDEDMVIGMVNALETFLDDMDENDAFGTEGWRHRFNMD